MQVKGEAIEAHINDKEAAYQRNISVLYINNRVKDQILLFSQELNSMEVLPSSHFI
jgi:hypothetical protein